MQDLSKCPSMYWLQGLAHFHKAEVRLPLQRPQALQTLVHLAVAVQPPGWWEVEGRMMGGGNREERRGVHVGEEEGRGWKMGKKGREEGEGQQKRRHKEDDRLSMECWFRVHKSE